MDLGGGGCGVGGTPIHIWMPIKLLSARCDALPLWPWITGGREKKGKAVIIHFNYFIFPFYDRGCGGGSGGGGGWGGGVELLTPRSRWTASNFF